MIDSDPSLLIATLEPKYFSKAAHQEIFKVCQTIFRSGQTPEPEAVLLELERIGRLEQLGGEDHIKEIADHALLTKHPMDHAKTIVDDWKLRCYQKIGDMAARGAAIEKLEDYAASIADVHLNGYKPLITYDKATFKPVELEHLWDPYLPKAKSVLFVADSGTGKTHSTAAFCAMFSNGRCPPMAHEIEPFSVIYLHASEDDPEEIMTVYHANGGADRMFHVEALDDNLAFDAKGLSHLKTLVRQTGAKMIVADPIGKFVGAEDFNDYQSVASAIMPVRKFCRDAGVTIWGIHHQKKLGAQRGKPDVGEYVLGSVAWKAGFRGVMLGRWHPDRKGVVVFQDIKGSLLNPRGDSFCFTRRGCQIEFLNDEPDPFNTEGETIKGKQERCEAWLRNLLKDKWVPLAYTMSEASKMGFADRTVRRARQTLGVKAKGDRRNSAIFLALTDSTESLYNPYDDD